MTIIGIRRSGTKPPNPMMFQLGPRRGLLARTIGWRPDPYEGTFGVTYQALLCGPYVPWDDGWDLLSSTYSHSSVGVRTHLQHSQPRLQGWRHSKQHVDKWAATKYMEAFVKDLTARKHFAFGVPDE